MRAERSSGSGPARRILFLTPQLPYPPEQGTAIRNYHLIAQVARRHDVALLSFADGASSDAGPMGELCRPLVTVPTPRRSRSDRLRSLLMDPLPDMAWRLWSDEFAAALRGLCQGQRYDCIQIEGIELARYGLLLRTWPEVASRVILDEHNAEYLLQRRAFQVDAAQPRRWPAAAYSLVQWRRLMAFERMVCRAADVVLSCSEADAAALASLTPGLRPLVVPNGVDVGRYRPDLPQTVALRRPAVVFTGKMDFRPNVDGILWFHGRAWPRVRAERPDAHLYVVGKDPHPLLQALRADPTVTVTGYVPDPLPYFAAASAYIVPLRMGSGTRLKVLEAMACGLPVISTTVGAEGIALTAGRQALLADSPADMARAVLAVLADPRRAAELGRAARELVLERYDWPAVGESMMAVYSGDAA